MNSMCTSKTTTKQKQTDDITRLVTPCMKKAPSQLLNLCRVSCRSLPPPRPSESLTLGLFIDLPDGGLARCVGEAGAVGMSWCSLSSAARWTHGGPSHINQFCRSSHMSKQHDKPPPRLLPATSRTRCQHRAHVYATAAAAAAAAGMRMCRFSFACIADALASHGTSVEAAEYILNKCQSQFRSCVIYFWNVF